MKSGLKILFGLGLVLPMSVLLAQPVSEPRNIEFAGFKVALQETFRGDDVLMVQAHGRHGSGKNQGLRLKRVDLRWERVSKEEVVVHIQPTYRRIFGKESMDYIRHGVPFRVNEAFVIKQSAKRYVVKWREQEQTIVVPASHFASKHKAG